MKDKAIKLTGWADNLPTALIFFLLGAFICGCNQKIVVEDYQPLKHSEWHQDSLLVFEMNIPDTKKVYDLSVNVRNEGQYPYSNLWVFVTITQPSGKSLTDTLELTLAKPSGEWLGSGLGDIYDQKYPYKQTVFFSETGKYTVTVRQGMRTQTGILKGIHDFGISLEKAL